MKIDLPDESGKVVSISVAQHTTRYGRRLFKECTHNRIHVDETLATLHCLDCDKEINPVVWIAMLAEDWQRVERITKAYKIECDKLDARSRVKCRHCGKITPVRE